MATEILVFVPGTLGTELWDGKERIWPGTIWDAISGFDDTKFKRLLEPNLDPRDIVRDAAGGLVAFYSSWIAAFEGIRRGAVQLFREHPSHGAVKTLYIFPYDWRGDLEVTAGRLSDFLDSIVAKVPDACLNLVCHSMGGVLTRYYLECGRFNTRTAYAKAALLVTFGTPHNGAPVAYAAAVGLHKTAFLSMKQTTTLANDPRYVSLYQLFPIASHSFIWDLDLAAAYKTYPADDPKLVARYSLNPESIAAWQSFRKGLTGSRPGHVRYFYIVGSRQETITRLSWTGQELTTVELDDSGDGTVSLPGAMDPSTQTEFVGKSHASLIETYPARRTLAALFEATTVFATEGIGRVTLSVRDLAILTDEGTQVQIEFVPEIAHFKGSLHFQRADISGAEVPARPIFNDINYVKPIPVELNSAGISYLNLKSEPLRYKGIYRPVLVGDDIPETIGPSFVVQAK